MDATITPLVSFVVTLSQNSRAGKETFLPVDDSEAEKIRTNRITGRTKGRQDAKKKQSHGTHKNLQTMRGDLLFDLRLSSQNAADTGSQQNY